MCPCILYEILFEGQKVQNFDTQKIRGYTWLMNAVGA